jgi:uncharacterized protein (TIGR02246 family)
MDAVGDRQTARRPEDLGRLFEDRLNAGDIDGLLALYEPEAVLHFPAGTVNKGREAIRSAYEQTLGARPSIKLEPEGSLESGDLALLTVRWTMRLTAPDGQPATLSGKTAEVARRQADGTWLWVIDDPTSGG